MKIFKGNVVLVAVVSFLLSASVVSAASVVLLGTADSFAVLGGSTITNTGTSVVTGNLGLYPGTSVTGFPPGVLNGIQYVNNASAIQAKADLTTAYNNAAGQTPATTIATELGGATLLPGIYSSADGTFGLTGTLTLDANNNPDAIFIFKTTTTLTTAGASVITLINGAQACNVFWQVGSSATLGTSSVFKGNILALTSITLTTGARVDGSVLAQNGAVTLDTNVVVKSLCAGVSAIPPVVASSGNRHGTINVVKRVINDNGGSKTIANFPLFINGSSVLSGITNNFRAPATAFAVTETSDPQYTQTFSGDCDSSGMIGLSPGDNKFCIITNNDIGTPVTVPPVPPLIDVVKVPNPLALPSGPGAVAYTYTLRNIGTVPVTNVTMVGDTCRPIVLSSGDTNNDSRLDVNETWVYRCTTMLSATHTNTVVATGWANGISATDLASATVVVGTSAVPPLIHITKTPSVLTLLAGGGSVTYTKKVTNPGTVPLNNVQVTDDKCGPVKLIFGDINNDSKLDPSETWTYTCQTNLNKTTTNIAIASGEANGLTVRDFAFATVVVAENIPGLPNTGFPPRGVNIWGIAALLSLLVVGTASYLVYKKKTA